MGSGLGGNVERRWEEEWEGELWLKCKTNKIQINKQKKETLRGEEKKETRKACLGLLSHEYI